MWSDLAEECLQNAERTNEAELLLEAHLAAGSNFLLRGEFTRARGEIEQSIAFYQPQHQALTPLYGSYNPKVMSLAFTSWMLWSMGSPDQARARVYEALHLTQDLGHPLSLVIFLFWIAWLHRELGEGRVALEHADTGIALASEHGFPFYVAWGTVHQGAALIAQKQWMEGIVQIRQGLEAREEEATRTVSLAWLAEGYGGAGQVEEGLATVAEALRLVEKNDECIYEAELYRLKGELLLAQKDVRLREGYRGKTEEAEECFRKSIEIARQQQARSFELRASMSLAHLWQRQGKQKEAHQLLSEIYNWFTEGFDTKDLQEARALLEELSH